MTELEGLGRALREVPSAATTAASWRALTGDAGFALIADCLTRTDELAQGWPCGATGTGCSRILVEHSRYDIEAVCEDRGCETVEVSRSEAVRQRLDLLKLARKLRPALHVDSAPEAERVTGLARAAAFLGVLTVGRRFAAALTLSTDLPELIEVAEAVRRRAAADAVLVLAPLADPLTTPLLSAHAIEVMALHQAITVVNGTPRGRILEFVRRNQSPGLDPSPWFTDDLALVVDPAQHRAWFHGKLVDFSSVRTAGRLLFALAQRPNVWVSRTELAEAVYGRDADPTPLPKRKSDLQSHLNAAGVALPIEMLGARDDEDGAYRLPIAPDRIDFWTPLRPAVARGDEIHRNFGGTEKATTKPKKSAQ
jgi:hypothetical protein